MDELTERGHLTAHERVLEAPVSTTIGQGIGHDLRVVFDFYRSSGRAAVDSDRRGSDV